MAFALTAVVLSPVLLAIWILRDAALSFSQSYFRGHYE